MRILVLHRSDAGEGGAWASRLALAWDAGPDDDVQAVDASAWMPMATGKAVDRDVSRELERRVRGFDHVHAVGYRCAWACGAAFGGKRPWSMTAWDRPRTTHSALIDRIAPARFVAVPSRRVRRDLDAAYVTGLTVVEPARDPGPSADRQTARARLDLRPDEPVVLRWLAAGAEWDAEPEVRWAEVHARMPSAVLIVAGPGAPPPDEFPAHPAVRRPRPAESDLTWLAAAADLVWLPDRRQTLALARLEAAAAAVPAVVDRDGPLADLIDDDETGRWADGDDPTALMDLLDLPIHRAALGHAARARAASRTMEDVVDDLRRALDGRG